MVYPEVSNAGLNQSEVILKDAIDGTLDGNYTIAQVQRAYEYIFEHPERYLMYSDVQHVLESYLASVRPPELQVGSLKYTGESLAIVIILGVSLMTTGAFMIRFKG
jgi:hypothetical protein